MVLSLQVHLYRVFLHPVLTCALIPGGLPGIKGGIGAGCSPDPVQMSTYRQLFLLLSPFFSFLFSSHLKSHLHINFTMFTTRIISHLILFHNTQRIVPTTHKDGTGADRGLATVRRLPALQGLDPGERERRCEKIRLGGR